MVNEEAGPRGSSVCHLLPWIPYICLPLLEFTSPDYDIFERLENYTFVSNFKLVIMNSNQSCPTHLHLFLDPSGFLVNFMLGILTT